jgi:hypothetical protein
MHLISRQIFVTESLGFPQRCIGEFISSKLRSSAAGLALPEFWNKQKPGRNKNAGLIFRAFSILVCSLNPWTRRHCFHPKRRKTITHRQMITSQKKVSLQYMIILAQNSLHSVQPFRYVLQYPKAMFCVTCTCPWPLLQIWVCRRMGAYCGSMSTNLGERMGIAWTTLHLTPLNSVKTSLFGDAAPVDTIVNYSATICLFDILSNLLFTVLQSCHAVYSNSLTLSSTL